MPRTTLNIDAPILRRLKDLQEEEEKTLGRLVSDLLAEALARRAERVEDRPPFRWIRRPMDPKVDILDKEALSAALDRGAVDPDGEEGSAGLDREARDEEEAPT